MRYQFQDFVQPRFGSGREAYPFGAWEVLITRADGERCRFRLPCIQVEGVGPCTYLCEDDRALLPDLGQPEMRIDTLRLTRVGGQPELWTYRVVET